jgi:hypothetical protein
VPQGRVFPKRTRARCRQNPARFSMFFSRFGSSQVIFIAKRMSVDNKSATINLWLQRRYPTYDKAAMTW